MSGGRDSPTPPTDNTQVGGSGWQGTIKAALILLLLGTGYQIFGWGLEGWVRDIIQKDPQVQEVLRLSRENRDKAHEMELLMIQIQQDQKTHGEFLLRLLDGNSGS